MKIPVVHFTEKYVPNPNPRGKTSLEEFMQVREALLAVSNQFGVTGPVWTFEEDEQEPMYWIHDDQYNDERYQNMEVCTPEGWALDWAVALITGLWKCEGWGISIGGLGGSHVLLFADRVLVRGPAFESCEDLPAVVQAARTAANDHHERKYGPLRRQLAFLKPWVLEAMSKFPETGYTYLATFDRYEEERSHVIWLLQSEHPNEVFLDVHYSAIHVAAVTADGTIHERCSKEFTPYTDVEPPYWLAAYVEEDRTQTTFNLVRNKPRRRVGSVTIGGVICDEKLKALGFK